MLPHTQQSAFKAARHGSHHSIHATMKLCSPPSPSALWMLWSVWRVTLCPRCHNRWACIRQSRRGHKNSQRTDSNALDALLDHMLLDEALDMAISPTQGATPKGGSAYAQSKGPCQSVGVPIPKSRVQTELWECVSPTQGATPRCVSLHPQFKGPHQSVEVSIPNSRGLPRSEGSPERVNLSAARPRGVAPRPPQRGGHTHGMLPLLDRHGGG